jgi:cytochrome P450
LHVNVHAVHMDPKVWPEPEKFDPLRFELDEDGDPKVDQHPSGLVAFGLGTRGCPGRRAYIKMAKAIIAPILKKYVPSASYKGNETKGVDMDTFLPNRFVAWDTNGINFKFT